jgi:hypothetical protein
VARAPLHAPAEPADEDDVVLFLNFASGLNLYYVAQNVASLPQQLQLLAERKRWQASRSG